MAEFLNLDNQQVKEQHEALIRQALDFIKIHNERGKRMVDMLQTDEKSINKMVDASGKLGMIYAIFGDSMDLASETLKKRREALQPKEGETLTATEKQLRGTKMRNIDAYIEAFEKTKGTTTRDVGSVTELQEKLGNIKRGNENGRELVRDLTTGAIAETSEGLSTTMAALGSAAINQSADLAKASLERMNSITNEIAQKESIRGALSEEDRVKKTQDKIESLRKWSDVIVTRKGMLEDIFSRAKKGYAELQEITEETQKAQAEAAAVAAEIATADDGPTTTKSEKDSTANPLGL